MNSNYENSAFENASGRNFSGYYKAPPYKYSISNSEVIGSKNIGDLPANAIFYCYGIQKLTKVKVRFNKIIGWVDANIMAHVTRAKYNGTKSNAKNIYAEGTGYNPNEDTNESAFRKNRFRNDSGESHKHSKFERWNIAQHEKAEKMAGDIDDKVYSAEMKLDPTGTLSEMNPVHIARMKKGKAKRKAIGQLALNILFPFAPIMRAIKKRKHGKGKKHGKKNHNPTNARGVQIYDSGMIADDYNHY